MTHNHISIATSALLCEVMISCWSAKKIAKKETEELTNAKAASKRAASVHKNLLADDARLDAVNKYAADIRNWLARATIPWSDSGARLIPTKQFMEFKQELDARKQEFDRLVADFVYMYPTLISAQAFKLGAMFTREDYPSDVEVAAKFRISYAFTPVPEVGDFRVDIAKDIADELEAAYSAEYARRTESITKDLWSRLKVVLDKMSDRLGQDDGKNRIFRNTLVDNALEVCELLKVANVTNDVELEAARAEVERAIRGVTVEVLRDVEEVRGSVKAKVDSILDKFAF
jgi:hypothetical protein